jgi:hypothetical protein
MDPAQLEALASAARGTSGVIDPRRVGDARYELQVRDREYAEQQEKSRREFEIALVDKQLKAATDVAWATKWAMVAAIASAIGVLIQAFVAVHLW